MRKTNERLFLACDVIFYRIFSFDLIKCNVCFVQLLGRERDQFQMEGKGHLKQKGRVNEIVCLCAKKKNEEARQETEWNECLAGANLLVDKGRERETNADTARRHRATLI